MMIDSWSLILGVTMNKFNDGAPRNYMEWLELGYTVFPCSSDGVPLLVQWQKQIINLKTHSKIIDKNNWKSGVLGVRLDDLVDLDIDNPKMEKFLDEIVCGAMFGRPSNPLSHMLFKGTTENISYTVPEGFAKYFKKFAHGTRLLDIRSGEGHFTYVPGSITPKKKGSEKLEWNRFTSFQEFDSLLLKKLSEICLWTALSAMFPIKGSRDEYMSSIAGILARHTDWTDEKIGQGLFKLALHSGSTNPSRYIIKASKARDDKTKSFGIPTLARILKVEQSDIAQLFSWVGVSDTGSSFSKLKVYETDPTMWKIKYKDTWITIMDSSHLLSWTKMSIHILENCYEVPSPMKPIEWKNTINHLLENVEKIKVDESESYYGQIGSVISEYLNRPERWNEDRYNEKKSLLGHWGTWLDRENNMLYFRLESLIMKVNDARLKYEQRKLTQYIRDKYSAVPVTLNINGKDVRTWRAPVERIQVQDAKSRSHSTRQNSEYRDSDTLKTDTEKKDISYMAHKKAERKRMEQLQDERMQKLQQDSHDNY